jgi:hypothetical protein
VAHDWVKCGGRKMVELQTAFVMGSKRKYLNDPSHDMEEITGISENFSFVLMVQVVQKSESPSVNCYNLSVTDMPLFLFSTESRQ